MFPTRMGPISAQKQICCLAVDVLCFECEELGGLGLQVTLHNALHGLECLLFRASPTKP